jgi:hypothetical protein
MHARLGAARLKVIASGLMPVHSNSCTPYSRWMCSKRPMKLGIVRPEMTREPGVQSSRQLNRIDLFGVLKRIHNIAQLIEQSFVILLVGSKPAVSMISHELFLERKVSGDSLEQIAKESGNRPFGITSVEFLVQPVDQIYELLVLVVDRFDADAVFVLPME